MTRRLLLVLGVLLATTGTAAAAEWRMDPGQSRLEFATTFETAVAPGTFRDFDARLRLEPDEPAAGSLQVRINVASADMNSVDVNKAIAGPEWFDFARFPRADFVATDIRRIDAGHYTARGMLSLKGVQRAVEVPFTWVRTGDTARIDGEFVVQRAAFGIGTGEWASTRIIGADVKIKFSVRLRQGA